MIENRGVSPREFYFRNLHWHVLTSCLTVERWGDVRIFPHTQTHFSVMLPDEVLLFVLSTLTPSVRLISPDWRLFSTLRRCWWARVSRGVFVRPLRRRCRHRLCVPERDERWVAGESCLVRRERRGAVEKCGVAFFFSASLWLSVLFYLNRPPWCKSDLAHALRCQIF